MNSLNLLPQREREDIKNINYIFCSNYRPNYFNCKINFSILIILLLYIDHITINIFLKIYTSNKKNENKNI
jgi:hypothetical protein